MAKRKDALDENKMFTGLERNYIVYYKMIV